MFPFDDVIIGYCCQLLQAKGRIYSSEFRSSFLVIFFDALSPFGRQFDISINAGLFSIGPIGTNFGDILLGIHNISSKKMYFRKASAKWHHFVSPLCYFSTKLLSSPELIVLITVGNKGYILWSKSSIILDICLIISRMINGAMKPHFNIRTVLHIWVSIIKIKGSPDRFIFHNENPILVRHLNIETAPRLLFWRPCIVNLCARRGTMKFAMTGKW